MPEGPPDEQFLFLSDVLPTAWQAVEYADIPDGGTVAVLGLGPIGQMSARIARAPRRERVFGVDLVPERLEMARRHGIEIDRPPRPDDLAAALRDLTDGRGPDSVIDAVGMEAHGSPGGNARRRSSACSPDAVAAPMMEKAGIDRLAALLRAIDLVRRGGTISISGVYGGALDPLPMLQIFDKQLTLRMGQANVRALDRRPHAAGDRRRRPARRAGPRDPPAAARRRARAYEMFQTKKDGAIKVVLEALTRTRFLRQKSSYRRDFCRRKQFQAGAPGATSGQGCSSSATSAKDRGAWARGGVA